MTARLLAALSARYPLAPIDVGEFATLKANGMTFSVEAYTAAGLGHVSVMRASGFFGLMKMDTLIINPIALDLPLYSYDRICAAGNDTLIVELYDTTLAPFAGEGLAVAKADFAQLTERDPGEHWYDHIKLPESISKKGKKKDTPALDALTEAHFAAYLSAPADKVSEPERKSERAAFYVNGLLKNGGPSTDVFKKALGEEKTAALFRRVLFGTAQ